MENNHAEDFERIESLDGYLAEHFKGDDENLFRGYHFFYGAEEYFAIETTKIYESFIDEYIDEVFKDGKFSTNELSTSELLRNHLKLFFEQQYLFRLTGYEFYRLAWQPSHVRVPKEKKSAGYDVQEISPFWKSVNLRSPIYILLFKASFWRSFIQSPWESNFYGDFHPGTHQQSRKFWIEKNFISEKDFSSASNLGTRALQFLRNHRYATLCATIKAYLEERARATKEFKNRLAGKSQNNESEKVTTTFADILRAIINICQKVYPDVYYKDSDIYKRAEISRQNYSRILNGVLKPSRENVIKFIFGLHLDVPTADVLLNAAGFPMTNAIKDAIVESNKVLAVKPTLKFSETFMDFFNECREKNEAYYTPVKVYNRAESDRQTFW